MLLKLQCTQETAMLKIEAYDRPGESRTGGLQNVSADEIEAVLGFKPNVKDDPYKVVHSWGFKVNGVACGIWDYKGSHHYNTWSTFGPREVFEQLFPGKG
jgi:hypothetical protein